MTLYERYIVGGDTNFNFYGNTWCAQTFTVGDTGTNEDHNITSVKLLMYRVGAPATITVSIKAVEASHKPTGNDLTSGTTDGDTLTTNTAGEWREVSLASYGLLASTEYAIVARALTGDASNKVNWKADGSSPTYTGGALVYSTDSGSSWTVYTGYDFLFEEYGSTVSISSHKIPNYFNADFVPCDA